MLFSCFVGGTPFYCLVLLPTLLLVITDFCIFIPIFKNIIHSEELIKDTIENRKNQNARRAKSTVIVTAFLAVVWLMAVLAGVLNIRVLYYVFYALIPVLGVLVLVLYVLKNATAKEGWSEIIPCCNFKSETNNSAPEMVKLRSKKNLLDSSENENKRGITHCCVIFFFCFSSSFPLVFSLYEDCTLGLI